MQTRKSRVCGQGGEILPRDEGGTEGRPRSENSCWFLASGLWDLSEPHLPHPENGTARPPTSWGSSKDEMEENDGRVPGTKATHKYPSGCGKAEPLAAQGSQEAWVPVLRALCMILFTSPAVVPTAVKCGVGLAGSKVSPGSRGLSALQLCLTQSRHR